MGIRPKCESAVLERPAARLPRRARQTAVGLGVRSGTARPRAAQAPLMSGPAPGGFEEDLPSRSRVIEPSLLLPAEVIIFELKPSLWHVVFSSLPIAGLGLVLMILSLAVSELPYPARHWGIVIGGWIVGLRVAISFLEWLGRTYVLTDRRVLKQHGILNVRVECLGLEEVENTFVAQAALQRALGIGNIFLRCSDSRKDAHIWEHVRRPKEVHAHIVTQIDRWKRSLSMTKTP
jgi:hypothetical protein